MRAGPLEITDLLWSFDASGARLPIVKSLACTTLRDRGQVRAARILDRLPAKAGHLDAEAVDDLGLRVHYELSRLGEELQLGRRVAALVAALLPDLGLRPAEPVRVVDVGCGLGQALRSIAARGDLPSSVELVGVDLNPVLTAEAARLARSERLEVRFVTGDAFAPGVAIDDDRPTIVVSTGLLHHLAAEDLAAFFAAQAQLRVKAFAHWDIAPCFWSTLGAWVFHQARMREPVSRHDGVLSARRAHPADVLLAAARHAAPGYRVAVHEGSRWHPRALDVLRPIVGVKA
ncbi:methyltransferase domain-containing protein [Xylanimonas sp. McL0601]|uniref:methyltransferase domain-containing protein n=1 Tax=Xylanimonas sp. McL0601 TaxID=3414739 RepID=UPI003CFBBBBF